MNVLLINSPSAFESPSKPDSVGWSFPLGLLSNASPASEAASIEIYDIYAYKYSNEEVLRKVQSRSYDAIGISCVMDTFPYVRWLASKIRQYDKYVPIIGGGPFATATPELYLEHTAIDYIIRGEGEIIFPNLLQALASKEDCAKVKGIVFWKNGKIISTPSQMPLDNLDQWFPAYHFFDVERYLGLTWDSRLLPRRALPLATTRGCPFSCTFCNQNYLGHYRERSIEKVIAEITFLKRTYKLEAIHFADATFTFNQPRTAKLCKALIPLSLKWSCLTRIDCLNENLLNIMFQANCEQIMIGLETVVQEILDKAGKRIIAEQSFRIIEQIQKSGIEVSAFILLGLPWETKYTIEATLRAIKQLGIKVAPNVLYPIPGTPIFEEAKRQGKIKSLLDLAEGFAKYNVSGKTSIAVNLSQVSDESIAEAVREIWQHNEGL